MPSLTAAAPTPEERQSVLRTLRHPRLLGIEVLGGLVVALALIPEAIAFSVIAGVDPRVGLFSAFTMAVTIAFTGGRPAMISAATGAVALVIAPLVASHGIHYLVAAILLAGVFQILLAVLGVAKLMRFIPRQVMVGFVNALAILVFIAQLPELVNVPWLVYPLLALALAIIFGLPKLTTAVPAPLVAIVVLTLITVLSGAIVPTVGDKGELPDSLPSLFLPQVPLDFETLQVIAPYALAVAFVGLLESLMTAKLVDDVTDTRSNKTREAWGQGVANLVTGFFGGMGGCAMIGQTMVNVKGSGARTRISTFLAGVFLLVLVVVFGDVVSLIPDGRAGGGDDLRVGGDLRLARHPPLVAAPHAQERNRGHGHHRGGDRLLAQPRDRRGPGRALRDGALRPAGRALCHGGAPPGPERGHRHLHDPRRAVLRLVERPLHAVRVRA